ncbi:uncharacterized protein LTR77_002295 [Saxophila tyrrhenica]|uniref:Uncharacterized protein n=1 Tax=Saxophila tyrrhenica TaxID=1690608 RepID=A0AAV9PIS1_9PEZI|nr:hypothetical protein LTR77_002295 [Saxophila tyrrhenica]
MSSQQPQDGVGDHNPMTSVKHDGRSSSGQLFNSMEQAKRHPENDRAETKRQSLADQSEPKGALGNVWDSMTKPQPK